MGVTEGKGPCGLALFQRGKTLSVCDALASDDAYITHEEISLSNGIVENSALIILYFPKKVKSIHEKAFK
jgi:hypothetical protein